MRPETNGPRLEVWAVDRIKPYAGNPRTAPDKAIAKVAGSLTAFGFQKPIVVDEAGGSGTTIIAAEMTGRACHAIELNPAYVDVAVKRWEQFAGQTATLEATGQSFAETDAQRYAASGSADNSAACYDAAIAELRAQHESGTYAAA